MYLEVAYEIIRVVLFYWIAGMAWSYWIGTPSTLLAVFIRLMCAIWVSHRCSVFGYHEDRMNRPYRPVGRLPPKFPDLIPWFGNLFSAKFDRTGFLRRVGYVQMKKKPRNLCCATNLTLPRTYLGKPVSTRVSLLGLEIYVMQDRDTVKELAHELRISSPMGVFTYVLTFLFGMSRKSLAVYREDDSGPLARPYTGSKVPPEKRIHHKLRHGFLQSMSGKGLGPTLQRMVKSLRTEIARPNITYEWVTMDDFYPLFRKISTTSIVQTMLGSAFLLRYPDFVSDLLKFDDVIPSLVDGFPSFRALEARKFRSSLRNMLKSWYVNTGRQASEDTDIKQEEWDPFGNSELIGYRHRVLQQAGHNDDDISATDLGLLWT